MWKLKVMRFIQSRDANSYEGSCPPTSDVLRLLLLTVLGNARWSTGYGAQHSTEYMVEATFKQCRG